MAWSENPLKGFLTRLKFYLISAFGKTKFHIENCCLNMGVFSSVVKDFPQMPQILTTDSTDSADDADFKCEYRKFSCPAGSSSCAIMVGPPRSAAQELTLLRQVRCGSVAVETAHRYAGNPADSLVRLSNSIYPELVDYLRKVQRTFFVEGSFYLQGRLVGKAAYFALKVWEGVRRARNVAGNRSVLAWETTNLREPKPS